MNARDIQQDILAGRVNAAMEEWDALVPGEATTHMASHIADAILAAGYSRPRTITTAEELEALPVGTVLLMSMTEGEVIRRHERSWYATGEQWSTVSNKIALPATVLYEPQP